MIRVPLPPGQRAAPPGLTSPQSIPDFQGVFPDEAALHRPLVSCPLPSGLVCSTCGDTPAVDRVPEPGLVGQPDRHGCFDEEFQAWSLALFLDFRDQRYAPVLSALTSAEIDQAPENTSVGVYSPRIMRTMPFTLPSPIQIFYPREVVHEEE